MQIMFITYKLIILTVVQSLEFVMQMLNDLKDIMLWEVAEGGVDVERHMDGQPHGDVGFQTGQMRSFAYFLDGMSCPLIEKPLFQTINDTALLRVTRSNFVSKKWLLNSSQGHVAYQHIIIVILRALDDFCVSIKETKGTKVGFDLYSPEQEILFQVRSEINTMNDYAVVRTVSSKV